LIPVDYNLGSLWVRKRTSITAALCIALVVFVIAGVLMLRGAIELAFSKQANPEVAVIVQKNSLESGSSIESKYVSVFLGAPEVKHGADGAPLGVGELVVTVSGAKVGGDILVRGVPDNVFVFRPTLRIVSGRPCKPSTHEAIIGARIQKRLQDCEVGHSFAIRTNRTLDIVGVFEDGGSNRESEVWTDVENVRAFFGLDATVSMIRAQLVSPSSFDAFKSRVEQDKRLGLEVLREPAYQERESESLGLLVTSLGALVAVFASLAAMIGAMITIHASVANRQREIGTLRALGFSRRSILGSILLEGLLLSLSGGLLGCAAALAMGTTTYAITNYSTWAQVVLVFDPKPIVLVIALGAALVMGLIGGLAPALRAALIAPIQAMRGK
jgi:putative ABC transport system permease protein